MGRGGGEGEGRGAGEGEGRGGGERKGQGGGGAAARENGGPGAANLRAWSLQWMLSPVSRWRVRLTRCGGGWRFLVEGGEAGVPDGIPLRLAGVGVGCGGGRGDGRGGGGGESRGGGGAAAREDGGPGAAIADGVAATVDAPAFVGVAGVPDGMQLGLVCVGVGCGGGGGGGRGGGGAAAREDGGPGAAIANGVAAAVDAPAFVEVAGVPDGMQLGLVCVGVGCGGGGGEGRGGGGAAGREDGGPGAAIAEGVAAAVDAPAFVEVAGVPDGMPLGLACVGVGCGGGGGEGQGGGGGEVRGCRGGKGRDDGGPGPAVSAGSASAGGGPPFDQVAGVPDEKRVFCRVGLWGRGVCFL